MAVGAIGVVATNTLLATEDAGEPSTLVAGAVERVFELAVQSPNGTNANVVIYEDGLASSRSTITRSFLTEFSSTASVVVAVVDGTVGDEIVGCTISTGTEAATDTGTVATCPISP